LKEDILSSNPLFKIYSKLDHFLVEFFCEIFSFDVDCIMPKFIIHQRILDMGYLSSNCYEKIKELEGKKIRRVIYFQWKNLASDDEFKSLDWLEIGMQDETRIVLHYGVENDGIEVVEFNFEEELNKIETEFKGQATLIRENATLDTHWFPILDEAIREIKFSQKKGENTNNQIILVFTDNHQIEISTVEEGMEVDFYEK